MITLEQISEPIGGLLEDYTKYIREQMFVENNSTMSMIDYIFKNQGKGIRPLLTLLSSALISVQQDSSTDQKQQAKQRTMLSAMLIEMIHTASLIHDDIIDQAYIRRGKPSINSLWGAKKAVLIGDYIFSRSYFLGMESGHYDLVRHLTKVMGVICSGELLQDSQSQDLSMTRDIYYSIIYGKTASLISCCASAGAISNNASEEDVANLDLFGRNLGMAFQIKDDILDYSKDLATGKPSCNDIKERKITLPLLTVIEKSNKAQCKDIIRKLSGASQKPQYIDDLYQLVISNGGIEMATEIMNDYISQALDILKKYPQGAERLALENLCYYIAQRDK